MNFDQAIKNIDRSINKKQPKTINPQWIKNRCKVSYEYIINNIKDELGDPDWDSVTSILDKKSCKLWFKGVKRKAPDPYEDKRELDLILSKYKDKLYLFISSANQEDKQICDYISIKLVRLSQKGNILAGEELMKLLPFLIDQWMEGSRLHHWQDYNDLITKQLKGCIKRYRYSGSFLGYLFRTLEYSGRALKPLKSFSLNQPSQITERTAIDKVVKDIDTGKIIIYSKCS